MSPMLTALILNPIIVLFFGGVFILTIKLLAKIILRFIPNGKIKNWLIHSDPELIVAKRKKAQPNDHVHD